MAIRVLTLLSGPYIGYEGYYCYHLISSFYPIFSQVFVVLRTNVALLSVSVTRISVTLRRHSLQDHRRLNQFCVGMGNNVSLRW